jgi:FkbM family methyltransferase
VSDALAALLSETPEAAAARAAEPRFRLDAPLVFYGAGTTGRHMLARLRRAGRTLDAWADDTPSLRGTTIEGVPVMTPADAAERFGDEAVFVVTMINPFLPFRRARERLGYVTRARVISLIDLAWAYPDAFLPYVQFETPDRVLRKRDDILRAAGLFADEESRRQFAAHLRFRLQLDHDALPPNSKENYFPEDVVPPVGPECVFVDAGAYDGDTIRYFLRRQGDRFGAIYAFEPDARNYERLRDYTATLDPEIARRIELHCAAVGDKAGTARFNMTGNASAARESDGTTEVAIVRIDETVPLRRVQTFVKYDVEGGEWEALRGTQKLVEVAQPLLAVSVYHRPDDLWQLPLELHRLDLDYRLFLRTQGEDGMDVICYAVPTTWA